jgi:hypothetical protein
MKRSLYTSVATGVGVIATVASYLLFEDGLLSIAVSLVWHGYMRTVNPDIPPPPPPRYDKNK